MSCHKFRAAHILHLVINKECERRSASYCLTLLPLTRDIRYHAQLLRMQQKIPVGGYSTPSISVPILINANILH